MMSSKAASKRSSAASAGVQTRSATKDISNQRIPLIHEQLTLIRTDAFVSPGSVIPQQEVNEHKTTLKAAQLQPDFSFPRTSAVFQSGEIGDMAVVL